VLDRSFSPKGLKSASITLCADSARRGFCIMELSLHTKSGETKNIDLTAAEARHLAQVLNAAANSCNAKWRKSSVTP